MKGQSQRPRTLKLDKPCSVCGKPIHYTYSGPVEGVCGRCTDKRKRGRRRVRAYHRGMVVQGPAPDRRSTASSVVLILSVMVAGAAAVAFVLSLFLS